MKDFRKQQGFSLTEISISMGVLSAMVIGGLNFFNISIGKAQASEAMVAGKIVADRVFDYFARFGTLPGSSDIFIGDYIPGTGSYIDLAVWVKATSAIGQGNGTEWGYVKVTMAPSNVQAALAGKYVQFLLHVTENLSFVSYEGCRTNIGGGALDGIPYNGNEVGSYSPYLPECTYGLISDSATSF
jgi:hypothetical protein